MEFIKDEYFRLLSKNKRMRLQINTLMNQKNSKKKVETCEQIRGVRNGDNSKHNNVNTSSVKKGVTFANRFNHLQHNNLKSNSSNNNREVILAENSDIEEY